MRRLHDGDLIKLGEGENSIYAEFINTPGRLPSWRMTNKIGAGILLTHDQAESFKEYLLESLNDYYKPDNESAW